MVYEEKVLLEVQHPPTGKEQLNGTHDKPDCGAMSPTEQDAVRSVSSEEFVAIDDGRGVPVNTPKFWGTEIERLQECISTGWISSEGPLVGEFERAVAKKCNRKYGVACSSGTAALDLAFAGLDLVPGDEVILPTLCIISCIQAIVHSGARPVVVDCADGSYNMDMSQVLDRITKRTRAILFVHTYEFPCDYNRLKQVVREAEAKFGTKIWTIEDAAEVQGQYTFEGLPCGSLGDIGTFSFYPNKQVTSGEGGMVVTDNEEAFQSAFNLRNLGFNAERRFVHTKLGYNYRMTNLQAAVGIAQVERLEDAVSIRRRMGALYTNVLTDIFKNYDVVHVKLPRRYDEFGNENIYWVYMLEITSLDNIEAADAIRALGKEKVGTRPCFWPMHAQPVFTDVDSRHFQKHFVCETFPNADRMARQTFYIPSGLALTHDDILIVCSRLEKVFCELGLLADRRYEAP